MGFWVWGLKLPDVEFRGLGDMDFGSLSPALGFEVQGFWMPRVLCFRCGSVRVACRAGAEAAVGHDPRSVSMALGVCEGSKVSPSRKNMPKNNHT